MKNKNQYKISNVLIVTSISYIFKAFTKALNVLQIIKEPNFHYNVYPYASLGMHGLSILFDNVV